MLVKQHVIKFDLGNIDGNVDAVNLKQLLGSDQHLGGSEQSLRNPGTDQNTVLRRNDQVGRGSIQAKISGANADWPKFGIILQIFR